MDMKKNEITKSILFSVLLFYLLENSLDYKLILHIVWKQTYVRYSLLGHVSLSGETFHSLKEGHENSLSSTKENKLQGVFQARRNTYLTLPKLCIKKPVQT